MNELTRAYMKLKQTLPTRENIVSKKQILDQVTIELIYLLVCHCIKWPKRLRLCLVQILGIKKPTIKHSKNYLLLGSSLHQGIKI